MNNKYCLDEKIFDLITLSNSKLQKILKEEKIRTVGELINDSEKFISDFEITRRGIGNLTIKDFLKLVDIDKNEAKQYLDLREYRVILFYFIKGEKLREIEPPYSSERIRQIKERALKKLIHKRKVLPSYFENLEGIGAVVKLKHGKKILPILEKQLPQLLQSQLMENFKRVLSGYCPEEEAEKVKIYAKEKGIELETSFIPRLIKTNHMRSLMRGDIWKAEQLEKYAAAKNMNLIFVPAPLEISKCWEKVLHNYLEHPDEETINKTYELAKRSGFPEEELIMEMINIYSFYKSRSSFKLGLEEMKKLAEKKFGLDLDSILF